MKTIRNSSVPRSGNLLQVPAAVLLLALSGCAVTPALVKERVDQKTAEIDTATTKAREQQTQEPPLMRIKGNFLGSVAQPRPIGAGLPPAFRDITLSYGTRRGNLELVATNLRTVTGLSIRINPDVFAVGSASANNSVARPVTAPVQAALPGIPPGLASSNSVAFRPVPSATGLQAPGAPGVVDFAARNAASAGNASQIQLPLSFTGDLADYLNQIASMMSINWEYNNGEIYFHRNITRIFNVMIPTSGVQYGDSMSGGSGSGSGSTSSGGATSSVSGTLNAWDSVLDALKSIISSTGRFSASKASGTIVVTDSRDVMEQVAKWIGHENAALNTQVSVDIRKITIALDDKSQIGLDLNLVYQKLNASSGAVDWAFKFGSPSSLTDGSAGNVGFNLTKPNSRWVGSNIATQALNGFGQIVSDVTDTLITKNRVPGRTKTVREQAYLASTTPATGGATGGGTGVPGLTPGLITYGTNLMVIPIIGENNTVSLELFDSQSNLLDISSVSTGSGATLQQINTPTLSREQISGNYVIGQGETLIIVSNNGSSWNSDANVGVTGASNSARRSKTMQVVMITPRILQGN